MYEILFFSSENYNIYYQADEFFEHFDESKSKFKRRVSELLIFMY